MILNLMASHFKEVNYQNCTDCAVARAVKALYPTAWVQEGVTSVTIDGRTYKHEKYNKQMFLQDLELAKIMNFSPEIGIRKLKIEKYDRTKMANSLQVAGDTNGCLV